MSAPTRPAPVRRKDGSGSVFRMTTDELDSTVSRFPFDPPRGYRWLIERGLAGFEPHSALQPWYLLPRDQIFSVTERWPRFGESGHLYAFARRQDCDDIACFSLDGTSREVKVVVVHGWTSSGYEVEAKFESIWDWLRSVVADIEDWVRSDVD